MTRFELTPPRPAIVSASPQIDNLLLRATRAAEGNAKVLITGESGVGKDLFARVIHMRSARRQGAFIAVNCAGLTETLLESELFGHVRGSFTGAHRDKVGKLQLAHGGTLFLDEVGEMSLRMQALLLRFLESGEIQTVGADRAASVVDVRLVAATNRRLLEMVAAGQFREDLLYRLRVIELNVPPLREHRQDIRPLVAHFASLRSEPCAFSEEALAVLERYHWPGNVRELQNVVEQSLWLSGGGLVKPEDLPEEVRASQRAIVAGRERRRQVADDLYDALLQGGYSFWMHIHPLFLAREITRHDLRELVRRGLRQTHGQYRPLMAVFGMPVGDHKRFLNFLAAHDCSVDGRTFRDGADHPSGTAKCLLPPLPSATAAAPSINHHPTIQADGTQFG
jgi:transcriptional regulator with PAS, ATPase and Fis domain